MGFGAGMVKSTGGAVSWAMAAQIVSSYVGSFKGLAALRSDQAHLAGFHVDDAELAEYLPSNERTTIESRSTRTSTTTRSF